MNAIKENSKAAFNRQAATYDEDMKGQHARSLYPVLLEKLSHIPFQSALDLGCGTGEMLKLILQEDTHKELCGIDLSEKMLAVAKSKLPEQVKLILGDSESPPFSDNAFDVLHCNDSFHHYPDPHRAAFQAWRVLAAGGAFVIGDCWQPAPARALMNAFMRHSFEGDVRIYSESELRAILSPWFSRVEWRRVGFRSCLAIAVK